MNDLIRDCKPSKNSIYRERGGNDLNFVPKSSKLSLCLVVFAAYSSSDNFASEM